MLWLETVNSDFEARRVDTRSWQVAVLRHAATKAAAMGVGLSVEPFLERQLAGLVTEHLAGSAEDVAVSNDRLVLRPSNGVLEASDYLSHKHDWVQLDEELTAPMRRAVYTPTGAAAALAKGVGEGRVEL